MICPRATFARFRMTSRTQCGNTNKTVPRLAWCWQNGPLALNRQIKETTSNRIRNAAGEPESPNPTLTGRNWPRALGLRARRRGSFFIIPQAEGKVKER